MNGQLKSSQSGESPGKVPKDSMMSQSALTKRTDIGYNQW